MTSLPHALDGLVAFGARDQILAGAVAICTLALVVVAGRAAWKAMRAHPPDEVLTILDAALTSAVVATGMWHFAGERLHFGGLEKVLLFAILEITVLTCAFRVRRHLKEKRSAGAESVVIWVVSIGSGVFAATTATSAPEAAFRLVLPLLATWLWERSLLPARREADMQGRIEKLAERVRAWFGRADREHRTAPEAVAEWHIDQLARAVVRAKRAGHAGHWWHLGRRYRRWRVDMLTVAANERAGLATRRDRMELLLAYIGTLLGTGSLIDLDPPAQWDPAAVRRAWERSRVMPEDTPPVMLQSSGEAPPEAAPGHDAGMTGPVPEARPAARPAAQPKAPSVRLSAGKARSMTAADLVPHVLARIDAGLPVTQPDVKAALHVGTDKAAETIRLAIAQREQAGATVTPIDRAARG